MISPTPPYNPDNSVIYFVFPFQPKYHCFSVSQSILLHHSDMDGFVAHKLMTKLTYI